MPTATEEQESRAFDDLWEKDRLAKLGREEAEASQRMQMDAAQKAVLDRQVAELHAYREMEKDLAEQEAQLNRAGTITAYANGTIYVTNQRTTEVKMAKSLAGPWSTFSTITHPKMPYTVEVLVPIFYFLCV